VRGEERALDALYARHSSRVYAIALRVLNDPQEAQEALQETFFELWRSATRFDASRASVDGWISTIARTRAIDRLRRRDVRQRTADLASLEALPTVSTPEDESHASRLKELMRRAIDQLPKEQREAIELAYFHGLPQAEIAEATATPLGTVKTRLRLALLKLGADPALSR
jgi:RNA polymerase sigma-70 factor (ECF subfamily)